MPGFLGIVFNNIDFTNIVLLTPTVPSIVTLACTSCLTLLSAENQPKRSDTLTRVEAFTLGYK